MSRAITLSRGAYAALNDRRTDIARTMIVLGSAMALILAGQPLPL